MFSTVNFSLFRNFEHQAKNLTATVILSRQAKNPSSTVISSRRRKISTVNPLDKFLFTFIIALLYS
ncbi:MAG: hypothetical protein J6M05_06865 [Cardiobacteriaceae bacterium]|nr:hypothetical protein [Cardiobacteriaceae bacterium]